MILQIINPFDSTKQYESLYTIDTRKKGVLSSDLVLQISSPNELVLSFTTDLPSSAYKLLKDGDYGIRLKKDGIDMVFVQDRQSKKIDSQGIITARFFSGIYKSKHTGLNNLYRYDINKSAITVVNRLGDYNWQSISPDVNVSLDFGTNMDYDNLQELMKSAGNWSWFDAGLTYVGDKYENTILIGRYTEIEQYGAVDSRFATEIARQSTLLDNPFDSRPLIEDITAYYNGRQIQFLFVALDTGAGASSRNASPVFDRTDYDFIDPKYPIIEIDGVYYIQNVDYTGLEQRFDNYIVTLSSNVDDGSSQIFNVSDALSYMYRKAVYYMRTQNESIRYDIPLTFKKLTFPKYFEVLYNKNIRNLKGDVYNLFNINEKILFKSIKYDLTKL